MGIANVGDTRIHWRGSFFLPSNGSIVLILLMVQKIRRSPVELGSLSRFFTGFYTSQVVSQISEPSTVVGLAGRPETGQNPFLVNTKGRKTWHLGLGLPGINNNYYYNDTPTAKMNHLGKFCGFAGLPVYLIFESIIFKELLYFQDLPAITCC